MPGKKGFTKRYYSYFAMLADLLKYDSNALYKAIFDGDDVKVPLEGGGNFSLKGTMSSIADKVAEIKPFTTETLVNGQYVVKTDYARSAERSERNETELNRLRTEFETAFEAYKNANQNAKDEKYMKEYKKFEYMENVFKFHDAFQAEFKSYEDPQGPDFPADADPEYTGENDVKEINEQVEVYRSEATTLYHQFDTFDNYVNSAGFDKDTLSAEFKESLGDMELTSQNLINNGLWDRFITEIDTAIKNNNQKIEELKSETQRQLSENLNSYRAAINEIEVQYQKDIDAANGKYGTANTEKQLEIQELSAELQRLEDGTDAFDAVNVNLNLCRDPKFKDVNPLYKINESGITELTDAQVDELVSDNNKNIEVIDKNNELANGQIGVLQKKLEEQNREYERLEKESSPEEYAKRTDIENLDKEIAAAQAKADLAKQILAKANKRGGVKNITVDDLNSIGISKVTQFALGSSKQSNDAVQAIIGIVGNDRRKNAFLGKTNTALSDNLGAAVKSLDAIFDRENGTLNKAVEAYKETHPEFEFKLHERIDGQVDVLSDFAGDNRRGQIYNAEDALAVYDLYKTSGLMAKMAQDLPDDPAFEGIKAELGKDIEALQAVCGNDKLSQKFVNIASYLYEFGSAADKFAETKASIQNVIDSNEQIVKEKQNQKTNGLNKLIEEKNKLGRFINNNNKEVANLQKQIEDDTLCKEYLQNANKVYNSVKGITEHKASIENKKNQIRDIKENLDDVRKGVEAEIGNITKSYNDKKAQQEGKYNNANKKLKNSATVKYNDLMTEKDGLECVDFLRQSVTSASVRLQSTARIYQQKIDNYNVNRTKAASRLALGKKAAMDKLNKLEKDMFERLAGTRKKFFSDSEAFTQMKNAVQEYINEAANDDNRTLNTETYRQKIQNAKGLIQAYVDAKDDSKWTESGQIRLDSAKGLLQLFQKKEEMLDRYAAEEQVINGAESGMQKITVISKAEESILKASDPNVNFSYNKQEMAPAQRRFTLGLEQIKSIFKPLSDEVEKAPRAAELLNKGITALAKGNVKAFTFGIGAVLACKEIEYSGKLDMFNKAPDAIDMLSKRYAKAPVVEDLARNLIKQELKPADFLQSLTQENLEQNLSRQAKEFEKSRSHSLDDLHLNEIQ